MSKRLSFSIAVNLLTENFKKGANTVKNSFRSMQMQIVTFAAALGAGGLGLSGLITRLKDTARETNRVITALKNISGDTAQFGDNLKYLNSLADKYGIAVNGLIESFAKFSASATQANMPMDQQRKIFESLSRASSAFGLTADENKGVMLALSQMMGKGKISSEELRKQMGEKLPVAMQAMAKAAGTSMAGLEKLLQQGQLMSADILPKFADALNEIVKDVDTDNLEASINRLDNAFGEFTNATGFQDRYKALIDGLTVLVKSAGENIKNIIIGVVAAIVFVISNALTNVYRSYSSVSKQTLADATTTHNKLRATIAARAEAEIAYNNAVLRHDQATGKQKIAIAREVEKAKQLLSARTAAVNKAHEEAKVAAAQAAAIKSRGIWSSAYLMMVGSIKKLGIAIKSMWNSFAPALLITALVTVGYKIYDLITATTRAEKAVEDFNAESRKQEKELNGVFNAYKKANEGTKEKERLLGIIKSKYGEYIKDLIDEKGHITDIEAAQRLANKALKESIALKIRNKAIDEVSEDRLKDQAETLRKLRKTIALSEGDETANIMAAHIGSLFNDDTKSSQTAIDEALSYIDNRGVKRNQQTSDFMSKTMYGLIREMGTSSEKLKAEIQDIENSFKGLVGDSGNTIDIYLPAEARKTPSYGEHYEKARKEWNEAKKELSAIEKDKDKFSKEQYDAAKSREKAAKEAFDNLGGKTKIDSSGENKAQQIADNKIEALRKLDEADKLRQMEKLAFDYDMQQKAIDILDEGFEKRTKQTILNLKKEKLAIDKFQLDLEKKQYEHTKDKYVSTKGDDKGFEAFFSNLKKNNFKDKDGIDILPEGLTPEDVAKQVKALTDAAKKEEEKGLRDINRDLSVMLKEQELMFASDLDRKLADLDTYYNEQLIKAGDNAELIAQIESNRKRSKSEVKVEDKLNKLDFEEQLKQERIAGMESIGMTELVEEKKLEVTKQYIQLKMAALKELADAGDEDAKNQIKLYEASLKKLDTQKPAKSLKSLADKAIFDTIKKGFEKAGDSAEEAEEKTTSLLSSISHKAGIVANITSELQSMFGGMDEGLDMALETVGNIAQGFATGGIVGGAMAVIGEGMKLFSKASEAAARHQKALKEIEEDRLASQRAYNLLLLEQNLLLKEAVTIFGEKQITRAANAIANYRDSLKDLRDEMQGDFTPNAAYEQYLEKGASSGGIMKAYFGNQLKDYRRQLDNYNKGVAALGNAQIVTGHKKTGLFGWGKGKDTYSSLLEVYPDVIDKEGKLNKERLQTIIDTRKMSDETKKYLQNLIDLQDQAEAAQEELRSYLQSTFGSLGTDIMTSLENAIKDKGVSAWEAFGEAGAKVIEELGKQIAYELFFADKFKKLQEQLEGVYGSGKDEDVIAREAMDLVGKFYQNIGSQMDLAQGFMENWQKEAEKYGLNLWKPDSSSTQDSSKGYSVSMDQDTGGAILGRVTGLHETGLRMEAFLKNISLDTSNYLSQSVSIANELKKQTDILNDSFQIHKKSYFKIESISEGMEVLGDMKDRLTQIEKNTKGLVSNK